MNRTPRTNWKDFPLSLLMGIGFTGMMGFLIGLKVLDMTPDLIASVRNILFLLISSIYLYAILGAVIGALFWIFLWIISHILKKSYHGRSFVKPWVTTYLITSGLLFIYLALTRQHLRSGHFDNTLLVGYYLTVLLFGFLLVRSTRPHKNVLTGKRNRLTLMKFNGVLLLFVIVLIGVTLVSAGSRKENVVLGDPAEIKAALSSPNNGARVAVIGWDGGEWSVIESLVADGYMPNLERLIENGVSAPFRSLPSTKSPLVWTSIATGKVPAKHGITDFGSFQFPGMINNFSVYPDGLGYYRLISRFMRHADLPVTSSTRRVNAIWNILSDAELSVGVVGWWATWPAEKVNGFILSDRFTYTLFNPITSALSLREGQTYPPDLIDEVAQFCRLPDTITEKEYARFMPRTGGRVTYPENWSENQYRDWNPMYQFRLAYTASESYRDAGLYLYQQFRPSLFCIYFEGIDMVSHFFWQYYRPDEFVGVSPEDAAAYGTVIPEFYRYMDDILGQILKTLEPGTDVLVMSDHGFGFDRHPAVPFRTGEHRLHGIIVASGPHFKKGVHLDEVSVLDVTPTILHLFGLPAARDMDGKIRVDMLNPEFLESNPETYIKSYETGKRVSSITRSAADTQVRDQIKALGYIN